MFFDKTKVVHHANERATRSRRPGVVIVAAAVLLVSLFPLVIASNDWSGAEEVGQFEENLNELVEPTQTVEPVEVVNDEPGPQNEVEDPLGVTEHIPGQLPASETVFEYRNPSDNGPDTGFGTEPLYAPDNDIIIMGGGGGQNKSKGGKLGNAPEALYRVLEKFLAKGKAPPSHFPVPYTVYTYSDGVEKVTDVLTKQQVQIDVDDNAATGQGRKDIRLRTTIEVDPLRITTWVERRGDTNPPDLTLYVVFPAFFYNGENGAPEGEPYWMFGYQTQPGHGIPPEITMTFSANRSVGSEHIFDFDWTGTPASPLGFDFGVFQVLDQDTDSPILPAFSNFVADPMPSYADLAFQTDETDTTTRKCMNWMASNPFNLSFEFSEAEEDLGTDFSFDTNVTIQQVPDAMSICTEEDRAANTYTVDYTASAPIDLLQATVEIFQDGSPLVTVNLTVEDMPAQFTAVLGDGYLNVDVLDNVGFVGLGATALVGLGAIPSMVNVTLNIWDIPDFNATWFQDSNGNGFALEAASCIGQIELAFSYGATVLPAEYENEPNAHHLFAYSDTTVTAFSIRLLDVHGFGFSQNNSIASNNLSASFCTNRYMYIIAQGQKGSFLTPNHDVDLRIEVDEAPTAITINWTVPFTLNLTTNDAIDVITADLVLDNLTANADIIDIPANMAWGIDPAGTIAFSADGSIGEVLVSARDPNGLPGVGGFFSGDPMRRLHMHAYDVPSFMANWSSEDSTPWTSMAFVTEPGTSLGMLSFALSTSQMSWVTLGGAELNRAMFYNNDTVNLGNGLVMEASLWLRVEGITRAEVGYGGEMTTIYVGFGTALPHSLRVGAELAGTSNLNPAKPEWFEGVVYTTALPDSLNLTLTPEQSFSYNATDELDTATANAETGSLDFHAEMEGLPAEASGYWQFEDPGVFMLNLSDRMDRIWVLMEDYEGLFGGDFLRIEAEVLDIPESIDASWDIDGKTATLSFLDGTYDEGLGEFSFLATEANETVTEEYINDLGTTLPCMTAYSTFTRKIDEGYWPWTVPSRLDSLYCRHPSLDTGADDYAAMRDGHDGTNDYKAYAVRVRELGSLDVLLDENIGHVDIEFSRNVVLNRQLYFVSDDFDTNQTTLAEVSRLPDGQPTNSFNAQWNQPGGHYEYTLSEDIPYIDAYSGDRVSNTEDADFNKLVLKDVPASVTFDYSFEANDGFAYFVASSPWEAGVLLQDSHKRTVGWLQMQSLFFNYSYALPGEESCSHGYDHEWCYRVFRLDTDMATTPIPADGVLGLYYLEGGLDDLIEPEVVAPDGSEYIPEWTFILDDFEIMEIDILWDIYIGFTALDAGDDVVAFDAGANVFPDVTIQFGLNIVVDYFWNSQVSKKLLNDFPLPLPPPFGGLWTVRLRVNDVKDYRDQNPIHLFPLGSSPVTFDDEVESEFVVLWLIDITLTLDVPGFHRFADHPTPFT